MDRKVKSLLKGAGLDSLMGGISIAEMNLKREEDAKRVEGNIERNKQRAAAATAAAAAKIPAEAMVKMKADQDKAQAVAKANADAREAKAKELVKARKKQFEEAGEIDPDGWKEYGPLKQFKDTAADTKFTSTSDAPSLPNGNIADFQFFYDRLGPDQRRFVDGFWKADYNIILDRNTNQTPEEFEKVRSEMEKRLKNPYDMRLKPPKLKDGKQQLRDLWSLEKLKDSPYWKKAQQFVGKDPMYRQIPPMNTNEWGRWFGKNYYDWNTRIQYAVNPEVKASLISEFGEYQRLNQTYDAYIANNNAKPPPPSYEDKEISEAAKGVAEEDVKFDKREQLKKIRDADDATEKEVAQKTATLQGMKTGNPINDQEIDEALAYIKWGEELREQISMWELAGANKDMTLQEYWSSIGEPDLIDVEAEVAKEKEQIQNRINDYKKSAKYILDQIAKWGMLVIDIGVNFLPYILPFPIGNVIQLGYQAFAPVGSIYHTEGSFTQKLQAGLVNGAEQAVLGMIGLGRKGRRKYMKTLMESEEGGEMGQIRPTGHDSRNQHALHDKTPAPSQRKRKVQRQT
jgi:hypothetical protein